MSLKPRRGNICSLEHFKHKTLDVKEIHDTVFVLELDSITLMTDYSSIHMFLSISQSHLHVNRWPIFSSTIFLKYPSLLIFPQKNLHNSEKIYIFEKLEMLISVLVI